MTRETSFRKLLFPKVKLDDPIDSTEDHLFTGELFLKVILDVAERGAQAAEDAGHTDNADRFCNIIKLLNMYRSGNEALAGKLAKVRSRKAA